MRRRPGKAAGLRPIGVTLRLLGRCSGTIETLRLRTYLERTLSGRRINCASHILIGQKANSQRRTVVARRSGLRQLGRRWRGPAHDGILNSVALGCLQVNQIDKVISKIYGIE